MKIFPDTEIATVVKEEKGRYVLWAGAGLSAEAGVKTAQAICQDIRGELVQEHLDADASSPEAVEKWADKNLNWKDPDKRYLTCLTKRYRNEARRVRYFRRILLDKQPSLAHFASSLLIANGYLHPTCLTTNFDHLLENAFTQQALSGWQAIRSDDEVRYVGSQAGRFFVVKLHGDVDTQNIRNTRRETLELSAPMKGLVGRLARDAGLVVVGTAGNEKSVWKLFEEHASTDSDAWPLGLFWGVYMGRERPDNLTQSELDHLVSQRIRDTEINPYVVDLIADSRNEYFGFFPVWGAGSLMFDVLKRTEDKLLIGCVTRFLDHEMRLRHVFKDAGLSSEAIDLHLESLRRERRLIEGNSPRSPVHHESLLHTKSPIGVRVLVQYGDITSRTLMSSPEYLPLRRAVVSPEDTCISAGGGVAYSLLQKAGSRTILNELAKFSPIAHRSVAVTSAGSLPVHYILHAASLKIDHDARYCASQADVRLTTSTILATVDGLDLEVVWLPLMASGVASVSPDQSFRAILEAIKDWENGHEKEMVSVTLIVTIYRENVLPRDEVQSAVREVLGDRFATE